MYCYYYFYCKEIKALQAQWIGKFSYHPVLSDEPENSNWRGARGWVTDLLDYSIPSEAEGYFCGPPPMIDVAIEKILAKGIAKDKLFFDKFSDQTN